MFKLSNLTRTLRNANPNQGGGGFGANTTNPFEAAGTNVFADIATNKSQTPGSNMTAPTMNNNGMPEGTSPPPLETAMPNNTSSWAQQGGASQTPAPQSPAPANGGGSPLDMYSTPSDNKPKPNEPAEPAKSIFETDFAGWEKAASNVDLTGGLEPEKVQLALSGTPEGQQAFVDIIQQVARSAMQNAMYMSTKVAGHGVKSEFENFSGNVPNLIKDHTFNTMWQGDDLMNHESAKPMVQAMTQQFRQQHPNATPEQVKEQVHHYLKTFTNAMTGQEQAPEPPTTTGMSVSEFFGQ